MFNHSTAFPLPAFAHDRIDKAAAGFLGQAGHSFDFSRRKGEHALIPANSVSWRIFKNQVTLFIGGMTAVLMEFAEPNVRDGVWQHSTFRKNALTRLKRTGLAAMVTVYGARSQAEAMIAGVVCRHGKVAGVTTSGERYNANDQDLLDWVQATAGYGFMEAYHRFAQPLSAIEQDAVFAEAQPAAKLYGAVGAPASKAELDALLLRAMPRLEPSPIVSEFLGVMREIPALPKPMRPLQALFVKAAVEILSNWIRERLELGHEYDLNWIERTIVVQAAKGADRLLLRSSPPVEACRRLGLPDHYLYRRA